MSTMQRMTLIGLYNYEQTFERDLFSGLSLPSGYDKTTFVNSLLLEHGEKCVLYTNPEFFKSAISIWSAKWQMELKRIYEALTAEYNPIWNYDRNEDWSDGGGRKTTSETNAGHRATDSPDFKVEQETNENATTEHKVSADNSSDYQPDYQDITDGGKNTATTSGKTQNLAERSNSKTTDQELNSSKHKGHIWGNIGVTTSSQMVESETALRFKNNLYGIATELFANELLIGIY